MSTHHCEECWAVLDPKKVLRCTKCKACRYCSRECQKRNWKRIHKRVCSAEPTLKPYIPVEMAIERALAKQPKVQKAPKDACCYICLEGNDGGKLMRGCACRGDSAGFVHIECLMKLAVSKEASRDREAVVNATIQCVNCKQSFQGALELEMARRCWRHYRENRSQRYNSTVRLADVLAVYGESDAVGRLHDAASNFAGGLDLKVRRAEAMSSKGQKLEALEILTAVAPVAKEYAADPIYGRVMAHIIGIMISLERYEEGRTTAADFIDVATVTYGPEDHRVLTARRLDAYAGMRLGRFGESKTILEDVLTIETRIFGHDHPQTQSTRGFLEECNEAQTMLIDKLVDLFL